VDSFLEALARQLLKGWFPNLPLDFLFAWVPKLVEILARFRDTPDQLDFELEALRVACVKELERILSDKPAVQP
jgi:hypothetical protein